MVLAVIEEGTASQWMVDNRPASMVNSWYGRYLTLFDTVIFQIHGGTMIPTNEIESIFDIVTSMLGVALNAVILGNMTLILANSNAPESEFQVT